MKKELLEELLLEELPNFCKKFTMEEIEAWDAEDSATYEKGYNAAILHIKNLMIGGHKDELMKMLGFTGNEKTNFKKSDLTDRKFFI